MSTILLTGAAGGIGSAAVRVLLKSGHDIVAVDREHNLSALRALSSAPSLAALACDLSSTESVAKLEGQLSDRTIDWIVCCHGFIDAQTDFLQESSEDIRRTFDVNTLSIAYLAHAFLPHMRPDGGIVAISSMAGVRPSGRLAIYSASKAAVNTLMQALALTYREHRFITICPGRTNTPMREKIANDAALSQDPSTVAELVGDIVNGARPALSGDIMSIVDGVVTAVGSLTH